MTNPLPFKPSDPIELNRDQSPAAERFPIVGIGASAGGLAAFTELLKHLPISTGMAFVLIQHLDPDHASLLAELLAAVTRMPVCQAETGMRVMPNQVYVIPPNRKLIIVHGHLQLSPREMTHGHYHPATAFFESLAADQGNYAIGVVLSGMDSDGAVGLAAIKAAGGITFAQCEGSAQYKGMPQSAARTGNVDFILSPSEIAEMLSRLPISADRALAATTVTALHHPESRALILQLLLSVTGVDFNKYKCTTINRRIKRRMQTYHMIKWEDYASLLQSNGDEVKALYQDLLINVTSFFRDAAAFAALKEQVFPRLMEQQSAATAIRIWIPGCATGEEAYSIAIALLEFLDTQEVVPQIQIFATDISDSAIKQARAGIYQENQVAHLSAAQRQRFFVRVDQGYRISPVVRELCIFARHDLSSDPPFSNLDLISCRNVLIYLSAAVQKQVMSLFHYGLKSIGFLLLGSSESASEFSDLFALLDKKHKIYARKLAPARLDFDFTRRPHKELIKADQPASAANWSSLDLQKEADQIVLDHYAPVGVVVNSDLEILQFRGETSAYLIPASGRASFNLLKMARHDLLVHLQTLIQQAKKWQRAVKKTGLRVSVDGCWRQVNLEVVPLRANPAGERYFLVLFEAVHSPIAVVTDRSRTPNESLSLDQTSTPEITEIDRLKRELSITQEELVITQEHLQSLIEEQQTIAEEFGVANEELLASNEELQSLNEEMEMAKEEIQVTNEELHTVNVTVQTYSYETNRLNNDLTNLFNSINIPILFLGSALEIRYFTPLAQTLFNLIPTDVGRPFSHIKPNINIPHLETLILNVMNTSIIHEQEVQDQEGLWYCLKISPYRLVTNQKSQVDGAVVSLLDVNALKLSAAKLKVSLDYVGTIVETVREPLVVLEADLRVKTANRAFYQTFQMSPEQVEHHSLLEIGNGQWNVPHLRSRLEAVLSTDHPLDNFEVEQMFDRIGQKTMLLNACKMPAAGEVATILLAIADITERKLAERHLNALNLSLEQRVQKRTIQLQQALDIEGGVNRITNKMHDSLDEYQILQTAVEELASMLNVTYCKASLYDREQQTATICYAVSPSSYLVEERVIKFAQFPEIYAALSQHQTFQFCSLVPDPVADRGTNLVCAIWDDWQALGDLWLSKPNDAMFTPQELQVVQQVANQCAIALRQSNLYQAAQLQVEELIKLDLLKDDFLSTVTHELRTPMANIKMATQMLEIILSQIEISDDKSNRAFQYLQILRDECQREVSLINDLLDCSRLDAGTEPWIPTTLNLQNWVPHIVESFAERIRSQPQYLEVHIPAQLPALTTDFEDLERILSELLHNACKYTPPGGQITVSAQSTPTGMQLSVSNSGVEIAAAERDRIFDKFYRIPNSDRWKHGGTGLGLTLVKKRVERLGGTIEVTSDASQTTFIVTLPGAR